MKSKSKLVYLLAFFALLVFSSCQNEIIDNDTPDGQEIIVANSTLANLMQYASANDGALDDLLDNANCLAINLPVTIEVNGITITINTLEDLELIELIYNEFEDDVDILEFLFPITIILNDYTQIVIENQEGLNAFIEDCTDDTDLIECVDFQYPISFSIYNSEFNIIDTVVIEDNEELYQFLENLDDVNDGAVLASLNFPVTLVYANGETLEVNNNQELEAALNAAEEDCDDDDDDECTQDDVAEYLQECYWRIVSFNGDDNLIQYEFYFNENGILEILGADTTVMNEGLWNMSVSNDGLPEIVISNLTVFANDLEGSWIVIDCDDDRLELVRELEGVATTIVIEQECEDDLDCSAQEISMYLQECIWYAGTNLYDNVIADSFEFNQDGIVLISNPQSNDILTGTWEVILSDSGIYVFLDLPEPYGVISMDWLVTECEEDRIKMEIGDNYLVFERDCNQQTNPFDCFEDFELIECDENENWTAIFNLSGSTIGLVDCDVAYIASFHVSLPDAENNTNPIANTETYEADGGTIVYLRIETTNGNFEVFAIYLNVIECNPFECFSEMVLTECGDNGFAAFDLESALEDCGQNDDFVITFHESITNAEGNVNALVSPYQNSLPNNQIIYVRVELFEDASVYEIFELHLIVENCGSTCSELDVDGFLTNCIWNIVSYNGSNDLIDYNFDFEENSGIVVIYTDTQTIDAYWSTSQSNDGVIVTFSNVTGANIQTITGNWLVVECEDDRLELVKDNDFMVLEKDCN